MTSCTSLAPLRRPVSLRRTGVPPVPNQRKLKCPQPRKKLTDRPMPKSPTKTKPNPDLAIAHDQHPTQTFTPIVKSITGYALYPFGIQVS